MGRNKNPETIEKENAQKFLLAQVKLEKENHFRDLFLNNILVLAAQGAREGINLTIRFNRTPEFDKLIDEKFAVSMDFYSIYDDPFFKYNEDTIKSLLKQIEIFYTYDNENYFLTYMDDQFTFANTAALIDSKRHTRHIFEEAKKEEQRKKQIRLNAKSKLTQEEIEAFGLDHECED